MVENLLVGAVVDLQLGLLPSFDSSRTTSTAGIAIDTRIAPLPATGKRAVAIPAMVIAEGYFSPKQRS